MLKLIKATLVGGLLVVAMAHPAAGQGAGSNAERAANLVAAAIPAGITLETTRQGPVGSFGASGAFADGGTFTVQDPVFGGPGPGQFVIVHATETFTGANGTFTVARTLRVTWREDPGVRTIAGNWVVISGTGAYEDLHGHGRISGTVAGFPPMEVFQLTYTGLAGD
jgi:hypothetical protein